MKRLKKALSLLLAAVLIGALVVQDQPANAAYGDRITISGTKFYAGGNEIWINGANTPWNNWNDFGGSFNYSWWDNHFQQLRNNGINATRVWITCDGEVGINIASNGNVTGATTAHWNDLDSLFQIAQNRGVYIMATMMSFDHFGNWHPKHTNWRNMINNDARIDSYVSNYLVPFVNRYKNNPWLWSIDLINEPDWVYEDPDVGQLSWDRLQTYFAKAAVAIHQNSNILVTVGMGMIKYNSATVSGAEGNKISNAALQAKVNSPLAKVDFYSPHYYGWQDPYWGNPMYQTPAQFGLVHDRPVLLGETAAVGSSGGTITQDYASAHSKGWNGLMAWTSNGVDSAGSLTQLGPATLAFKNANPNLVYPGSGGGDSAPYNFENSQLHSFYQSGGASLSSSADRGYAGSRSLKISINGNGTYMVRRDTPTVPAGSTVTFRVWVPSGANLASIQPYVMSNNWTWYGNFRTYASLTPNAWNTITVQVPSGAAVPIQQLGVEVATSSSWNGSLYVDSISW